jgi:hypothetical protein
MADDAARSRIPAAALALGLLGLVPFGLCALAQAADLPSLPPGRAMVLGRDYGAVILSFLGGIRWGLAIGPYGTGRLAPELSGSVVAPLAAWMALMLPDVPGLSLLAVCFLMQALWDVLAVESGRLPAWFGRLRMILTTGAVLSLLALLVAVLI